MKLCPNCNQSTINAMKKCPTCGTLLNESHNVSFMSALKAQVQDNQATQKAEKDRITEMDKQGIAYCPKCHSTSLSANKKGFGIGKAVIGRTLIGGIGLVAGNIGAQKVKVTCLKCGYQFKPGEK